MSQVTDAEGPDGKALTIAGLEIYTDKSALSTQMGHPFFKAYHAVVKEECLYRKAEDLLAWYPVGGFVARTETAPPYGGGNIIYTAKLVCKDGEVDKVLAILKAFADFVKRTEHKVLAYTMLTRPKEPNAILMFERYTGPQALEAHGSLPEFTAMFRQMKSFLHLEKTVSNEWQELNTSFVGNVVAGKKQSTLKL